MEKEQIAELLEKYWLGITDLREEEELRLYFNRRDVPDEWKEYILLFGMQCDKKNECLDDSFDERILAQIRQEGQGNKKTKKRFLWLKYAASLVLFFAVGIYLWAPLPWEEKDTFQHPEEALAELKKTMAFVSEQMRKSGELVQENLEKAEAVTNYIKL